MTKFKTYKFGAMTFKSYFKTVGQGFEVGVTCQGKNVFVGNFVHAAEAKNWWGKMHMHMNYFVKHHEFVPTASATWYCKYLGSYLYKPYYAWLDKAFAKYTRTYSKQFSKGFKQYKSFEKHYYAKAV